MDDNFFSIGQISKLFQISIRTLRYYDDIGLLKPAYIDSVNNYRYYTTDQILYLYIINELKYQGFSLKDINDFLVNKDIDSILNIYKRRKKEIRNEINELLIKEERLQHKIDILDKTTAYEQNEQIPDSKVEIKDIPVRRVVNIRRHSPFGFVSVTLRTIELLNLFHDKNLQAKEPYMIVFWDDYRDLNVFNADYEMCAESYSLENHIGIENIRDIPGGLYISIFGKGYYEASIEKYNVMINWIKENGYKRKGPTIKLFHTNFALTKAVGKMVYELQIHVEKMEN